MGYGIPSDKHASGFDETIYMRAADICRVESDEKLQTVWHWMHKLVSFADDEPETWSYSMK